MLVVALTAVQMPNAAMFRTWLFLEPDPALGDAPTTLPIAFCDGF